MVFSGNGDLRFTKISGTKFHIPNCCFVFDQRNELK